MHSEKGHWEVARNFSQDDSSTFVDGRWGRGMKWWMKEDDTMVVASECRYDLLWARINTVTLWFYRHNSRGGRNSVILFESRSGTALRIRKWDEQIGMHRSQVYPISIPVIYLYLVRTSRNRLEFRICRTWDKAVLFCLWCLWQYARTNIQEKAISRLKMGFKCDLTVSKTGQF